MHPMLTRCPVCHDELLVARLVCRACGTSIEGRFAVGRLARLTLDQLHFVEVFLRCEGKLNRMQEELGLSYPTVRSRLDDVIAALGYGTAPGDSGGAVEDQKGVLERLARHEISAEQALELISSE
ncbi:MAG: DUF2089 domain-containing protein [Chloroflexi bacterium]|nr:DUF2089 domain-containing protein [Chloroflexota bacterium]